MAKIDKGTEPETGNVFIGVCVIVGCVAVGFYAHSWLAGLIAFCTTMVYAGTLELLVKETRKLREAIEQK